MTKLQKLYSTIQNLKELGLELGDDLIKQTNELEQDIIKKRDCLFFTERAISVLISYRT